MTSTKGIIVGAVSGAIAAFIVLFFSSYVSPSKPSSTETSIKQAPRPREQGFDPDIHGYPGLIGTVKRVEENTVIFISSWCLKAPCEQGKIYEYRARIGDDALLKRLNRKTEEELAREAENIGNPGAPPNPFWEKDLALGSLKAGETITVLIKEIVDDTTIIAKELRVFQPSPPNSISP